MSFWPGPHEITTTDYIFTLGSKLKAASYTLLYVLTHLWTLLYPSYYSVRIHRWSNQIWIPRGYSTYTLHQCNKSLCISPASLANQKKEGQGQKWAIGYIHIQGLGSTPREDKYLHFTYLGSQLDCLGLSAMQRYAGYTIRYRGQLQNNTRKNVIEYWVYTLGFPYITPLGHGQLS